MSKPVSQNRLTKRASGRSVRKRQDDAQTAIVFVADPTDADLLAQFLKADNCQATLAWSWKEVMAMPEGGIVPTLVACDLDAFGTGGERALKLLASMWPTAPVIAIADAASAKNILTAMRAGAADCLARPIQREALALAVSRALERARLLKENMLYQGELERAHAQLKKHFAELELDQRAGRNVQMSMLPPSPMVFGRYKFTHQMWPSLFLSADFVDYFQITDRHLAFYVADVSGHGAGSAFITVLLKNFSRRFRREYEPGMLDDPAIVLHWLNQDLFDQDLGRHTTMFLGIIDVYDNKLHYANAAHFPNPVLAYPNGHEVLEMPSQPLGLSAKVTYQSVTLQLPEFFVMLLFTDGILEVMQQKSLTEKEGALIKAACQLPDNLDSVWKFLGRRTQKALSSDRHLPDDLCALLVTQLRE